MALEDDKDKKTDDINQDIEKYLEEKERMEALFQEKFTKVLTVMFTDLKGSTSIAEAAGDLETRMLIKHHNDIVFPIIKTCNGVLVKTIGDGTLSYFENAQDGVRAATRIQKGIDDFNLKKTIKNVILIRIGLHTGKCIVEKDDIFGDVVNTASRFESSANPGEVYISEETYNSMSDKTEIYCRFIKTTTLKGKKDPVNVYKAFWNKNEIEADKVAAGEPQKIAVEEKRMSKGLKLALIILIPIILVALYIQITKTIDRMESATGKRSLRHSVETAGEVNPKGPAVPQKP